MKIYKIGGRMDDLNKDIIKNELDDELKTILESGACQDDTIQEVVILPSVIEEVCEVEKPIEAQLVETGKE
jgi:hypothetical protein